jgi:hypothetical protein
MKRAVSESPDAFIFFSFSSRVVALYLTVSYSSSSSSELFRSIRSGGDGAIAFLGGAGDILNWFILGGDLRRPGGGCGLNMEGRGETGVVEEVEVVGAGWVSAGKAGEWYATRCAPGEGGGEVVPIEAISGIEREVGREGAS